MLFSPPEHRVKSWTRPLRLRLRRFGAAFAMAKVGMEAPEASTFSSGAGFMAFTWLWVGSGSGRVLKECWFNAGKVLLLVFRGAMWLFPSFCSQR